MGFLIHLLCIAFTSSLSITIFTLQFLLWIQCPPVVTSDDLLHVGHCGITDLHLLPVVVVVQEAIPFEVFVNESQEEAPMFVFTVSDHGGLNQMMSLLLLLFLVDFS